MIEATITGAITIQCAAPLKHQVLRQAMAENTFANPDYLDAVKTGRSPLMVPKAITTYQQMPGSIIFPRGYGHRLFAMAASMKAAITWTDNRVLVPAAYPGAILGIDLREYQIRAIDAALVGTQGMIVSPTGSGKTLTALELIRRRSQRAVILVHSQLLADQWRQVVRQRLGIVAGLIGGGVWSVGREITIAMMQTLIARPVDARAFGELIGLVVVDECHHAPAGTFSEVIGMFPGQYRYGFTATPQRGDGLELVISRLLGNVVATVLPGEVQHVGGIVPARVDVVDTGCLFAQVDPQKKNAWTDLVSAMVADRHRTQGIARLAVEKSRTRQTLVMTERVEHAIALADLIPGSLLVHGKLPAKERQKRMAQLATARVVVGTKGLLGEGLDCSVWSCLILASPMSGATPLLQAVGRVIRPAPGKKDGLVVDVVDAHPFALGAFKKRATVYRQRQWPICKVAA
ncbi:MAG: DEAD/DEAH box helicase [Magnetococcales bacterium]|nr:DEAD/DEAH box helicase [Magnetococcales bacterium]